MASDIELGELLCGLESESLIVGCCSVDQHIIPDIRLWKIILGSFKDIGQWVEVKSNWDQCLSFIDILFVIVVSVANLWLVEVIMKDQIDRVNGISNILS